MDEIVSEKYKVIDYTKENGDKFQYKTMKEIANKDRVTKTLISVLKEDKKINRELYVIAKDIGVNIFVTEGKKEEEKDEKKDGNDKYKLKDIKSLKRDIIKALKYIALVDKYMENNEGTPDDKIINLFKVTYLWELSPIVGIEYEERYSREEYLTLIINKIKSIK